MRIIIIFLTVLLLTADFTVTGQQQFQFVAEVGRLMDIIINSLYTQKQIFLRELISNASDALDKIRFLSITNPDVLGEQTQLQIKIQTNQEDNYIQIIDNGIGMTKNELINNLGIVANTGTTNFLDALEKGQINLIGQFGVGFYSSFLAASKVQVISKHNDDIQHKWISSASNTFTVEEDNSVPLKRGTIIRLHLKEDARQYINPQELQKLIQRYSSFINYPIYLKKKVTSTQKVEKTEEQLEKEKQQLIKKYEEQGKEIDEQAIQEQIQRIVQKTTQGFKFERLNQNKPLWIRDKYDIKKSEYQEFFKAVFKDNNNPITWSHFKAEGDADFVAILFIPERSNFDQFDNFYEKKSQVKLYVRRVLINDQFEQLLPRYLNFLKSIVDSDSLPLNVNRQNLRQKKTLQLIGAKIQKKAIQMLVDFNPQPEDEDEQLFEEEDQQQQSLIEDSKNRDKLAIITRWYTTNNVSQLTSLDDYINRMKQGQKHIYFLGGQDRNTLQYSPLIQKLVHEGYQVILGDDPLDQTIFSQYRQYKTYKIVNVARNDFKQPYKTDQARKEVKYLKKKFQPLIDYAKKQLFQNIKDVKISLRLVNNPVAIIADLNNNTPNRQRLQQAAALRTQYKFGKQKNILQINPHDPMIQQLNKIVEDQPDENSAKLIQNLYYAALIHSGFLVKDPQFFSKSVFSLINTAFEVKEDIQQIKVTEEDIQQMQPQTQQKVVEDQPNVDDSINLDTIRENSQTQSIQNQEPEQNIDL